MAGYSSILNHHDINAPPGGAARCAAPDAAMGTHERRRRKSGGLAGIKRLRSTSVNPDDAALFFPYDVLRKREKPPYRGLPLAGAEHPSQKTRDRSSLGVVRNTSGDHRPCDST